MGWDLVDYVCDLIEWEGGLDICVQLFNLFIDKFGFYRGCGNDNEWGVKYVDILIWIMNVDMVVIESEYDWVCQFVYVGGNNGYFWGDVDWFWMGLWVSFLFVEFRIEYQIGCDDLMMLLCLVLCWLLYGKYDGWGVYGELIGVDVYIMGVLYVEFGFWGLCCDYMFFDEMVIWKQIVLKNG